MNNPFKRSFTMALVTGDKRRRVCAPQQRLLRFIGTFLVLTAVPQEIFGFATKSNSVLQIKGQSDFATNAAFRSKKIDLALVINSFGRQQSISTSTTSLSMSDGSTFSLTGAMQSNLAVNLDQPLLPRASFQASKTRMIQALLALVVSDAFKVAALAFMFAFVLSLAAKSSKLPSSESARSVLRSIRTNLLTGTSTFLKKVNGRTSRIAEKLFKRGDRGVPLTFDDSTNEGWGVCTLHSKRRLGKSSFIKYDFDLPRKDNVLPLQLGQQLSLCCLDSGRNVAKADFYPYVQTTAKLGRFAILAPNYGTQMDNEYAVGSEAANFGRVLKDDLKAGDEIALKLGPSKLDYRGQYLPVTDMLYFACGVGIAPVLEQVKAVLPSGSSSVKSVSVVWVNSDTEDFDVTAEQLEKEYFKFSTKLAVSCIVENLQTNSAEDNLEIQGAISEFTPGTMAVMAGPPEVAHKARAYLINRGYPEDCICVL